MVSYQPKYHNVFVSYRNAPKKYPLHISKEENKAVHKMKCCKNKLYTAMNEVYTVMNELYTVMNS